MKFQKFTLLFACLLSVWSLRAQELEEYKTWSAGIGLGYTKSYTDITQYAIWPTLENRPDIQYSINAHLRKSLSGVFSVQMNLGYDRVQGTLRAGGGDTQGRQLARQARLNRWGVNSNFIWFHTSVVRGGFDVQINLNNIDMQYRENKERKFLFYLLAGGNIALYNPDVRYYNNRELPAYHRGNGIQLNQDASYMWIGRLGSGIRYKLNNKMDLGVEVALNYAASDLLDGAQVSSPINDAYVTGLVTLNYHLPSKTAGAEAMHIDWANPGKAILADINDLGARIDSVANIVDSAVANADSDGDGVIDSEDKEPYTPYGAEVDADGKAKDSDGDGVYDGLDQEPNTPAGRLVNFQGKEIITTTGTEETSPIVPGVAGSGLADGVAAYFPSIFFDTGGKRIRSTDIDKLVRVATLMAQNKKLNIKLIGHADIRGGTEFNENLAKQRAEAARDYLVNNLGADTNRITVESKGESAPLSPTLNNVNRRVDILGM